MTDIAEEEDGNEVSTTAELPPLSEFLLSAADILSLKLSARLVVVSSVVLLFDFILLIKSIFTDQFVPYERPTWLGYIGRSGSIGSSIPCCWSSSCFSFSLARPRSRFQNITPSVLLLHVTGD